MRSNRWSSTLVVVTLLGTIFAVGTGAQAGPVSAHSITGATALNWCGGGWIDLPCPENEVLELDAVEGVGGTAIYRPNEFSSSQDPVHLSITCMSFSSGGGQSPTSLVFRPGRGPAESPEGLSQLGLSGHVFRGSGVSQDGQTYYFVVADGIYWNYDYYSVSSQRQSGACGTGNYVTEIDYGAFDIIHAGNVPPQPQLEYSCEGRTCTFDGTPSRDLDGYVASYEWWFLYGYESLSTLGQGSGSTATFTYPDTYGRPIWVYLEVVDDSGDAMGLLKKIYAE